MLCPSSPTGEHLMGGFCWEEDPWIALATVVSLDGKNEGTMWNTAESSN